MSSKVRRRSRRRPACPHETSIPASAPTSSSGAWAPTASPISATTISCSSPLFYAVFRAVERRLGPNLWRFRAALNR